MYRMLKVEINVSVKAVVVVKEQPNNEAELLESHFRYPCCQAKIAQSGNTDLGKVSLLYYVQTPKASDYFV
jgi:hypothetical protein